MISRKGGATQNTGFLLLHVLISGEVQLHEVEEEVVK